MNRPVINILLIEFNQDFITRIKETLSQDKSAGVDYIISWAQKEDNILKKTEENAYDAILISYEIPNTSGIEILNDLKYKELTGPIIMMADAKNEEFAIQAIREGAYDYIIRHKDFEKRIPLVINDALNIYHSKKEKERLQKEIVAKNSELEAANKKLKTLDRIKSDFVANVAHEFRTPLTVIKGSLELAMSGEGIQKEKIDILQTAVSNSNRLLRLVNDLLDISKIESGKMQLKKETIDMNKIIGDSINCLENVLKDRQQKIQKTLSSDLPKITADEDKMAQVMINLINNAIKYSPEHSEITVKSANLEKEIMITVEDKGEGIEPKNIDKIFDKFTRVTAEKKEGTGLGLPIVKDIITLHNGRIWVESETGKGSRFFFTLPKI